MRKIRFWSTIGDAYGFVFGDATRLVRLSWFWWIAALVLGVAVSTAASRLGVTEHRYQGWLVQYLVMVPALGAFAVSWHRAVLVGSDPPWMSIHLGARELRYALFSFVIAILSSGPFEQLLGGDADVGAIPLVADALVLVCSVIALRVSLCLPAIAIEHPLRLGDSWRLTRGNTLRLVGGSIFVAGPIYVLTNVFVTLLPATGLAGLLAMTSTFLEIALSVCFLSFAYRQLTSEPAVDRAGEVSPVPDPV